LVSKNIDKTFASVALSCANILEVSF